MSQHKILLITGEVSGDAHAAEVVKALKNINPNYRFYGIGGDALREQGMELFFHISKMAFLGIGEIIRHLPFIQKVMKHLVSWTEKEKPDGVILVDYPGFNIRLAKRLKDINVPVVYFISPQIWAWGRGRVDKIRRTVDKMIVLFPFEKTFYQNHGVDAEYVGHPLVDKHAVSLPPKTKELVPGNVKLGLLPGSRKQEVVALLPRMIRTARGLYKKGLINAAEIVRVEHIDQQIYMDLLQQDDTFISVARKTLAETLPQYDAVLVASGTATLECGYYGVPMVIVYAVSRITYWLGRMLVKVPYIGLVNIVAEKQVAVELIQNEFTVEKAFGLLEQVLQKDTNASIRKELQVVREKLGSGGAAKKTAKIIDQVFSKNQ